MLIGQLGLRTTSSRLSPHKLLSATFTHSRSVRWQSSNTEIPHDGPPVTDTNRKYIFGSSRLTHSITVHQALKLLRNGSGKMLGSNSVIMH